MPRFQFSRTVRSIAAGWRWRIFFPCTLMIEQNEQLNGQPRPTSTVAMCG